MHRAPNILFGGGGYSGSTDKPRFRHRGRWLTIRYIQYLLSFICLPYIAIAAKTQFSFNDDAPKLIDASGGWGYIIVIVCFSVYIFISTIYFFLFLCWSIVLSPREGLGMDVFFLITWVVALAAEVVAQVGYHKSLAAQGGWVSNAPLVAHVMTTIALVLFIISSAYLVYLSTLQLSKSRNQQRRVAEVTAAFVTVSEMASASASSPSNTNSPPSSSPPSSSPQITAARPTSATSSMWSRIRRFSSSSSSSSPTEPKPETAEERAARIRERIIAQRIEAVQAPPTYWYATSNRPRRQRDEEAGDESLPLYMP